jgi:carboxymethylenebutenolidase
VTPLVIAFHGMLIDSKDLMPKYTKLDDLAADKKFILAYPEAEGKAWGLAPDKVTEAVSHLNPDQVTADLNAVSDYANKLPASNGKLFVGGFCWGGGQTFRFATNRADLAAAFVFYGPPPDKDAMVRIKAPVYGFYAGNDARIGATLPDTTTQMKAAGKTFDPVVYEGAGHGFMRAGEAPDANDANKKARQDAWVRWKDLLGK